MNTTNHKPNTDKDSFRDTIATVDKDGDRVWVFPNKPKGKYYDLRTWFTWVYLTVFFALPFIKYNGEPLFLFNVSEKKFILFGSIFWAQDFFIFGLGMLIFIVIIALFTVVFGRLFCGWACPQTIFMEMIFRKIEYWIDGDANYQKALKKAPWNADKIRKRVLKFLAFYSISFIISCALLSYLISVDQVFDILKNPAQNMGAFIGTILFTTVFFFIYWWFREQVCLIVCPYGRMQGVLTDKNTVAVAYDYVRGEDRHKFKKNELRIGGDCIDCNLCVKVCPTGIDIRNGLQLECVSCTACMDACDNIMESVGLEKGLIRYASEEGIKNKVKLKFTGRMKAYTAVLLILIGVEVALLTTRSDYDATILRAKGMLYQEQPNNQLSNVFTIKLVNKTRKDLPVQLKVENFKDYKLEMIGKDIVLKKEGISEGGFFVYLNKSDIHERKVKLEIGVYSNGKKIKTVKTTFLGPIKFK
ncbi:MAG: cytochrome c oxidase accessory protein FixG [Bacteroidetes bacterium]|jgi:cytochrome c oxidase accessory protein FixG|nr:cytochrome c oxidase accessory protein FixG [Bacteroidota bacterium]MDF2450587.1 cytochrome c oxidase accessory protein FixG [Bacteroidota bacterium]